ncbi:MAG: homoserine dehydrogenase [Gemmatimonadota bacterium]|nr:homoserine dehydrogenase [Gemmatimonadota bacterium]
MPNHRPIGIGLIGLGVVGAGVVRILKQRADYFSSIRGVTFDLRRIAVKDVSKSRESDLPVGILTASASEVVDDPDIRIVVEVMGGLDPARGFCLKALENGKDLATANKALLAEHGNDLFGAAARNGANIGYEASVCGGIPIIRSLTDGLAANRIQSIYGILNGTTNYILTRMADNGGDFQGMLRKAQEKGFAEADPTMDIDGTDVAQKLALLCRIAFRVSLDPSQILKEGISHVSPLDIDFARELGYTIKLLAIAKEIHGRIEARVHPVLVPSGALLANIKDEFNAVEIVGNAAGPQVLYGRGAGQMPTASAVVSDLLDLAERRLTGRAAGRPVLADLPQAEAIPPEDVETSFYCRFTVYDQPGVLARIARIFSEQKISIATVIQHGRSETEQGTVPLIMTTHEAREASMRTAVQQIDRLSVITEPSQILRIEAL